MCQEPLEGAVMGTFELGRKGSTELSAGHRHETSVDRHGQNRPCWASAGRIFVSNNPQRETNRA